MNDGSGVVELPNVSMNHQPLIGRIHLSAEGNLEESPQRGLLSLHKVRAREVAASGRRETKGGKTSNNGKASGDVPEVEQGFAEETAVVAVGEQDNK